MAPTLYTNLFDDSKEKKPRSEKQKAAFEKARLALAEKRKSKVKEPMADPRPEVEVKSIPEPNKSEEPKGPEEDKTPPTWFKEWVRNSREHLLKRRKGPPPPTPEVSRPSEVVPEVPEVKEVKRTFVDVPTYMAPQRNLYSTIFPGRR